MGFFYSHANVENEINLTKHLSQFTCLRSYQPYLYESELFLPINVVFSKTNVTNCIQSAIWTVTLIDTVGLQCEET